METKQDKRGPPPVMQGPPKDGSKPPRGHPPGPPGPPGMPILKPGELLTIKESLK